MFQTTSGVCCAGTGVVTSVPSDSPDDFAALRDLKNKKVGNSYQLHFSNMIGNYDSTDFLISPVRVSEEILSLILKFLNWIWNFEQACDAKVP